MTDIQIIQSHDNGKSESFDPKRLSASIESACNSVQLPPGAAKDTARNVVHSVEKWLANKIVVTSNDIQIVATQALTVASPEAGYIYKHQHSIL